MYLKESILFQKFKVPVFILFCTLVTTLFSFSGTNTTTEYSSISKRYAVVTADFNTALSSLDKTARAFKNKQVDVETLQNQLTQTRYAFKRIEFLLAFYHNEFVKSTINGAPLLHIERTGSTPSVLNPEGLQTLDELVFADDAAEKGNEISYLTTKVKNNYKLLYDRLKVNNHLDESLLLPIRLELIRIFSLGITGFDTPGSLNGIAESAIALQSMRSFLEEENEAASAPALLLFDQAIAYLQKPTSFETFDRLVFIRDYLNPLYECLGKIQLAKNVTSPFLQQVAGWNAENTSLFAGDFLNPYHFTALTKEEDNEHVKVLGKTLFYDKLLSAGSNLSCVSCHDPAKGFTDQKVKSESNVQGQTVLRNSPTLLNAVYADRYFYDLRAFTLEQQVEHVIFNAAEFNTSYGSILDKLNAEKAYQEQTKKAFGTSNMDREKFAKALASYVLSLTSSNSAFDYYMRSETATLNPKIKDGFNLFMGKANCATCHFAPTFSGLVPPFFNESESEILGVLEDPKAKVSKVDSDKGRIANRIASEKAWIYQKSFKTPTIRNIAETAPYFHNGAYTTLEEVIEFYDLGGGAGLGLDVVNQTLSADPLNLTAYEKEALIAFMKSLSELPAKK